MDKRSANCCICAETGTNLRQITESDSNDMTVGSKLKLCVPEIDWIDDFSICGLCIADVNQVYQFREKCLNSDRIRKEPPPVLEEFPMKSHKTKACKVCDKKFGSFSNLNQHLKYHEGKRCHICKFCGKTFITHNDLKVHEKIHLNKKEYKCEECSKSYNTHKDLRTHKFVVHTDPSLWKHVCEICDRRFPVKSNYDVHMRRHTNERPFSCHLCDKKFIEKYTLQKHFKTHSNVRAFVCEICKKEYKDRHVMEVHKAKIHGTGNVKVPIKEKKHFCHVCPKSYFEKNKLTRHLCTHTGEKPYLCKLCPKRFADKSYVTQHMKKMHNIVENEEN